MCIRDSWNLLDTKETEFNKTVLKFRKSIPSHFKVYTINYDEFKNEILSLVRTSSTIIELPAVEGIQKFSIQEASSLSEGLALKFPMIKSYVAQGIDDPSATARFSFGTDGFHGVIFYTDKPSFYIDPYTKNYNSYISYSRSSLPQIDHYFSCEVDEQLDAKEMVVSSQRNADDGLLRIFRLALVCSGEYAPVSYTHLTLPTTPYV